MLKEWLEKNKLLFGFLTISVAAGISGGILQFIIPLYALSMNANNGSIGLIKGISQLGGIMVTLPSGFLIDRYGSRRVLLLGGLFNVFFVLLLPVAPSIQVLILILYFEGSARTFGWTAINSAFIKRLGVFGHGKSGWIRASMAIGMNFAGPLIAGQIIESASYFRIFAIVGIFTSIPACIMIWNSKKSLKTGIGRKTDGEARQGRFTFGQLKELFKNRKLIKMACIQSLGISCYTAFSVYILVLLVNGLHCSTYLASVMISTQGMVFIAVMFFAGIAIERFNYKQLYLISFSMQLIGMVTSALSGELWIVWLGALSIGFGTGLLTAMSYTMLGKTEGDKGKIAGVFYTFTGSGIALGPVFSGFLSGLFGIRAAFAVFVPLLVVVLIYLVFMKSNYDR